MQVEVLADPNRVAERAAELIAVHAQQAITEHGVFNIAVSGGRTPEATFALLGERTDIEWSNVRLFQVDERVAPEGDGARNKELLRRSLLTDAFVARHALRAIEWMSVDQSDLGNGAADYAKVLDQACGSPVVLDLVLLGLGSDGHTASLIPEDPVLAIDDRDVAVTGVYQGHRRMTLTWPVLDRAKSLLWIVTGESKREALQRWFDNDPAIPATLPTQARSIMLTDEAALPE